MTEAFEKWTLSHGKLEEKAWDFVHPLSDRAAHFWLTAFVKEVRKRQEMGPEYENISDAFDDTARDFGLDGDKP